MRAALCRNFGPPEALTIETLEDPAPAPGEILVDARFAALNFFDTLIIQNRYQVKPAPPFSPGAEFSGRVAALGAGVAGFAVGQRVAGHVLYGACRTRLAVAAQNVVAIPDGVSDEAAAGLFVTYGTSLHALKQRAELKPGESLAVLGASGGVGIAAVELGRIMGARVIACASSPEKLAFAQSLGASVGIDYSAEDLKEALKRETGGQGVDVVYDPVGGDLAEAALRATAWKGRFLVVGFAAGTIPKIPLNLTLLKGCDIRGVFWGEFIRREPQAHRDNMAQLLAWVAGGQLSAHVHAVYPLERIAEALGAISRREAQGKVLIGMN
ncbi:MAG: NADPH:quinone oxidoreductase family protein [Rhizobiales bacterium]|nr:NADPH:quinone oxidoreductase family protein [Hyphomicrobiales bacterium]